MKSVLQKAKRTAIAQAKHEREQLVKQGREQITNKPVGEKQKKGRFEEGRSNDRNFVHELLGMKPGETPEQVDAGAIRTSEQNKLAELDAEMARIRQAREQREQAWSQNQDEKFAAMSPTQTETDNSLPAPGKQSRGSGAQGRLKHQQNKAEMGRTAKN